MNIQPFQLFFEFSKFRERLFASSNFSMNACNVMSLIFAFVLAFLTLGAQGWIVPGPSGAFMKYSSKIRSPLSRNNHFRQPKILGSNPVRRLEHLFNAHEGLDTVAESVPTESYKFESNVARVMDIIIHSLYSNKDVFIRELISNAADACDKKRFRCLSEQKTPDNLKIRVYPDRIRNTLTIEDAGCGMNKQDLIENLGRIAESGTKKFLETVSNKDKEDLGLIGQFGVGFYSAFLVANKVTVVTKGSSGEQLKWEASANSLNTYNISQDLSTPMSDTGTKIILDLKEESDQYLDEMALKQLLEKYSEFIPFPIELQRNVSRPEQVPDTSAKPEADGTVPTKTVMKKVLEWTVVNDKKPLWMRAPKQCTKEEYTEFYKHTFKAYDTPLGYSHFALEGNVDFRALLFVPAEIPYELSRDMFANTARQMRLYVKRVFINDKFEDLLPRWLIFMRGVVDSNDLPLNVGREILQQSRSLRIIKQRLTKKSLDIFHSIAQKNDTMEYVKFWKNYGKYIKLGVIEDEKMREEIVPLIRFYTSANMDELTSFPDYVNRMKPDQNYIYYASGETKQQAAMSPAIEKLKKKGYEVIFVSDPLDEMYLQHIDTFGGKKIVDAAKEMPNTSQSAEEKREKDKQNEEMETLRVWMKTVLGDRITKVEASTRLVDSPATLIQSEYGVSPNMQRYYRANTMADSDDRASTNKIFSQAVLELNPHHPVVRQLQSLHDKSPNSAEAKNLVEIIFNTAALAAGYTLDNSVEYSQQVVKLLTHLANTAEGFSPASSQSSTPSSSTPHTDSDESSSSPYNAEPINAEPINPEPLDATPV
jgi:molecular chaperone HtpG